MLASCGGGGGGGGDGGGGGGGGCDDGVRERCEMEAVNATLRGVAREDAEWQERLHSYGRG